MNSMRQHPLFRLPLIGVSLASGCALTFGCAPERSTESVAQPLTPATPATLAGQVKLDGSSTVLPISRAMAKAFSDANPGVRVNVGVSGTAGGFEKLCSGQIDVAGASRPINAAESQRCQSSKVDYIELPIAFDSLSLVVSKDNAFIDCLTVAELGALWAPAAEGKVTEWSQVREGLPAQPIALFGPDKASGTYDYFTLATVGAEGSSRSDYTASADDDAIESGVARDPNALGFFGYSYYLAHAAQLKSIAVDNGKGCVKPSPETVKDGSYQPLSRPIFIYVNRTIAARPEVRAFVRFFLAAENAQHIQSIGYVPLPPDGQRAELERFDSGVTGSALGAHGSVIGVRPDRFGMDKERLQSALVQ
jgi:phosphate transport system substrate-binding protein